jgi:hypothetical protein
MADLVIGAVAAAGFLLVVDYARARGLKLSWWRWVLTLLGFFYGVFVLEVIATFLEEGSTQAAVVMGSILGFAAVVWGVLLGRFVFSHREKRATGRAYLETAEEKVTNEKGFGQTT